MNPIGGYFELELHQGKEYHENAIRLNSGRNAFEYILRAKEFKKVYLPYYTCDVLLEPIAKLKLDFEFYHVNEQLEPIFDYNRISNDEAIIYINYFGIKGWVAKKLSKICPNLIIDNTQAFFDKPIDGIDTFYSPRKFFGIPDGGYLFTNKKLETVFDQDISYSRFEHLLGRIDLGAEKSYESFNTNNGLFIGKQIKRMSKVTQRLLESIHYKEVAIKRHDNFTYLHSVLEDTNKLEILIDDEAVPMIYPYFVKNGEELKKKLIEKQIFVATYWPNVIKWAKSVDIEHRFASQIIPLPIDQRYGKKEMEYIVQIILGNYYE